MDTTECDVEEGWIYTGRDREEYDGCMLVVLWEGDAVLPVTMLEGGRCTLGCNEGRRRNFAGCDVGER
jgi:hypothetical protein